MRGAAGPASFLTNGGFPFAYCVKNARLLRKPLPIGASNGSVESPGVAASYGLILTISARSTVRQSEFHARK
jgi:hypothetical protein